jgi:hypothetical protein
VLFRKALEAEYSTGFCEAVAGAVDEHLQARQRRGVQGGQAAAGYEQHGETFAGGASLARDAVHEPPSKEGENTLDLDKVRPSVPKMGGPNGREENSDSSFRAAHPSCAAFTQGQRGANPVGSPD